MFEAVIDSTANASLANYNKNSLYSGSTDGFLDFEKMKNKTFMMHFTNTSGFMLLYLLKYQVPFEFTEVIFLFAWIL